MKRLLFSIITLILTLLCIEGFARLFPLPQLESPSLGMQLQAHPSRIWSMRPGTQEQFAATVTIDNLGMRATDTVPDSDKWLILGDSSFFGHGLNDDATLHHHLENALKSGGAKIDVLCGATPGYSILQSLDFMNEIGWGLNPRVLVIGNLWSDNNFDHFQDEEWMKELKQPQKKFIRILSNSYTFIHLTNLIRPDVLRTTPSDSSPHAKISWVRDPFAIGKRRIPLPLYINALSTLILEAKSRNISTLIIQPANRHRLESEAVEYTWDPYFEAQRAIASHFMIPIIDVAPTLRAFGLDQKQAFLDNMHPTSQANFWVAQRIMDEWKQKQESTQDWLPKAKVLPNLNIPDQWATMSTTNHDTLP